jgi:outer membrane phospholipase A
MNNENLRLVSRTWQFTGARGKKKKILNAYTYPLNQKIEFVQKWLVGSQSSLLPYPKTL